MRMKGTVLIIFALAAIFPSKTAAQTNSITIQPAPTTGAGSVTARGVYTTMAGWNVGMVNLNVVPAAGGLSQQAIGKAPAGGNWGPITITNLNVNQL